MRSRWLGWKRDRDGQLKAPATSSSLPQPEHQWEHEGSAVSGVEEPDAKWQALESQDDDQDGQSLQRTEREATPTQRVTEEVQVSLLNRFAVVGERRKKQLWLGGTVEQRLEMYRASKPVLRKALLRWLPTKSERQDFQRRFEAEEASQV